MEDKLNETLNYVNESLKENTENNKISDKIEYYNVLKKEVGSVLAGYEQLLLNNVSEFIEVCYILFYIIYIVKIYFFS